MGPDGLILHCIADEIHIRVCEPIDRIRMIRCMRARGIERRHSHPTRGTQQALEIGNDISFREVGLFRRVVRMQVAVQSVKQDQTGTLAAQFVFNTREFRHG
jgi:hypothetical protein